MGRGDECPKAVGDLYDLVRGSVVAASPAALLAFTAGLYDRILKTGTELDVGDAKIRIEVPVFKNRFCKVTDGGNRDIKIGLRMHYTNADESDRSIQSHTAEVQFHLKALHDIKDADPDDDGLDLTRTISAKLKRYFKLPSLLPDSPTKMSPVSSHFWYEQSRIIERGASRDASLTAQCLMLAQRVVLDSATAQAFGITLRDPRSGGNADKICARPEEPALPFQPLNKEAIMGGGGNTGKDYLRSLLSVDLQNGDRSEEISSCVCGNQGGKKGMQKKCAGEHYYADDFEFMKIRKRVHAVLLGLRKCVNKYEGAEQYIVGVCLRSFNIAMGLPKDYHYAHLTQEDLQQMAHTEWSDASLTSCYGRAPRPISENSNLVTQVESFGARSASSEYIFNKVLQEMEENQARLEQEMAAESPQTGDTGGDIAACNAVDPEIPAGALPIERITCGRHRSQIDCCAQKGAGKSRLKCLDASGQLTTRGKQTYRFACEWAPNNPGKKCLRIDMLKMANRGDDLSSELTHCNTEQRNTDLDTQDVAVPSGTAGAQSADPSGGDVDAAMDDPEQQKICDAEGSWTWVSG